MTDVEFYQLWLRALWKGILEPILLAIGALIKLIIVLIRWLANGFVCKPNSVQQ